MSTPAQCSWSGVFPAATTQFGADLALDTTATSAVQAAMVYVPTRAELEYHLRAVAQATSLPIMLYNNPPAYRVNIEIETLERLAELRNIVAIKESAPDPRRFTDLLNALGERYVLFAGL